MGQTFTNTPADFTAADPLLYSSKDKKWYRFVDCGDSTLQVFEGRGGLDSQIWSFKMVMSKGYARSVWDNAVAKGFVSMTQ